jgi:uncharacterized membrane protein
MPGLTPDADLHGPLQFIVPIAVVIEVVAVLIIAVGLGYALIQYARGITNPASRDSAYARMRAFSARILLLGLELLVAADIVRTVALEPTLESVGVLGLLVLIRTFLSWSLVVEIEGRWPWQPAGGGAEPRPSL